MLIKVADYILTLGPTVITFPSDLNKLSQDFEKISGVPGVVGCLDGSYVEIQCPSNKVAATCCNRHHHLSLTLQAVCDNKRLLTLVWIVQARSMTRGCSENLRSSESCRQYVKRASIMFWVTQHTRYVSTCGHHSGIMGDFRSSTEI
ncbi:hypothetical protein V5799_010565 [Amblyomma americanum]|uniref:Uncharacterized protein n=1 Tax=Amblyomma americanum TaxID=6943 RepID=A0AAQ4EJU1_AMBAM